MHIAVAGTVWTLLDPTEPADKGRDLGLRQTNVLNSCLRIGPLGITVYMEFGMLRQQEHWFLVDSGGRTDLESGVVSNVASALYFLWIIVVPLSSDREVLVGWGFGTLETSLLLSSAGLAVFGWCWPWLVHSLLYVHIIIGSQAAL